MRGLLGVRLWGLFGALVVWGAGAALLATAAWAGTRGFLAYRLYEAERRLDSLLDGRRYRFLSASAVVEAAPGWAEVEGVHTRTEWVRVRIEPNGGLAVRLIAEARLLSFSSRRVIEGRNGEDREGAYQCTPADAPWDDLLELDAAAVEDLPSGAPLPPLPGPLMPTLAALEDWTNAERGLARGLGRASLEGPEPSRRGPRAELALAADAAGKARAQLQRLTGPVRSEAEAWLGVAGGGALDGALAAVLHLDVVIGAATQDPASADALLSAYVARRRAAREALEERLRKVGVFAK